jgi:hypothetical protein
MNWLSPSFLLLFSQNVRILPNLKGMCSMVIYRFDGFVDVIDPSCQIIFILELTITLRNNSLFINHSFHGNTMSFSSIGFSLCHLYIVKVIKIHTTISRGRAIETGQK